MKPAYSTIAVLILATIVLEIVNIYFLNNVATDGLYVSQMKDQIQHYEEMNTALKIQVLEDTSLTNVSQRAKKLGFVESKNFISLYSPLEIAVRK